MYNVQRTMYGKYEAWRTTYNKYDVQQYDMITHAE